MNPSGLSCRPVLHCDLPVHLQLGCAHPICLFLRAIPRFSSSRTDSRLSAIKRNVCSRGELNPPFLGYQPSGLPLTYESDNLLKRRTTRSLNVKCSYCNEEKPEELFYRISSKKSRCKACFSAYISAYLKSRPTKTQKNRDYAKKSKPQRQKISRQFLAWIKSAPCMDCGVQYPPYVMDFDHREPKASRRHAIGFLANTAPSGEALMEEIYKCDLVCANCHRERTYRRKCGPARI